MVHPQRTHWHRTLTPHSSNLVTVQLADADMPGEIMAVGGIHGGRGLTAEESGHRLYRWGRPIWVSGSVGVLLSLRSGPPLGPCTRCRQTAQQGAHCFGHRIPGHSRLLRIGDQHAAPGQGP
jgi:hypothetical protein